MVSRDISALRQKELQLMANGLRVLAVDMIHQANSGHPGLPLGCADLLTVLFRYFIKGNHKHPGRDRFVLSAGHGCALLYALHHMLGVPEYSLEQLKKFRQLGSCTPGHPEFGFPAIEATSGPLGQGLANVVGMALAQRKIQEEFPDLDLHHKTYVLAGDGCLMEGLSQEALSLAAHWNLKNLIVLWDNNSITIDGETSLSGGDTEEQAIRRFQAASWCVRSVDGHCPESIMEALTWANYQDAPVFLACKTHIGYKSPRQDHCSAHGSSLKDEEIFLLKQNLQEKNFSFAPSEESYSLWKKVACRQEEETKKWHHIHKNRPSYGIFMAQRKKIAPDTIKKILEPFWNLQYFPEGHDDYTKPRSTRKISGKIVTLLQKDLQNNQKAHKDGIMGFFHKFYENLQENQWGGFYDYIKNQEARHWTKGSSSSFFLSSMASHNCSTQWKSPPNNDNDEYSRNFFLPSSYLEEEGGEALFAYYREIFHKIHRNCLDTSFPLQEHNKDMSLGQFQNSHNHHKHDDITPAVSLKNIENMNTDDKKIWPPNNSEDPKENFLCFLTKKISSSSSDEKNQDIQGCFSWENVLQTSLLENSSSPLHFGSFLFGSADLGESTQVMPLDAKDIFSKKNPEGNYLHYGVREHAMGAIANGLSYYGQHIPVVSTFFVFSDYCRPALRLSCLTREKVIYVMTHDSVALGEDGPTHQPIEHLASLRAMPNLCLMRPCNTQEVVLAWAKALHYNGPSMMVLSRQDIVPFGGLPQGEFCVPENQELGMEKEHQGTFFHCWRGLSLCYVTKNPPLNPQESLRDYIERVISPETFVFFSSGSEVSLTYQAVQILEEQGHSCAIVSCFSWFLFSQQHLSYQYLMKNLPGAKIVVELGSSLGWRDIVGPQSLLLTLNDFGISAPGQKALEYLGFTGKNIARKVMDFFFMKE